MAILAVLVLIACLGLLVVSVSMRRMGIFPGLAGESVEMPRYLAWALAIAVVALNVFAYDVEFGIGYGLFGACFFLAILLCFPKERRGTDVWFLAIVGIVACILFGFRANEFVQAVNVVTALVCACLLLLLRSLDIVRWKGLWLMLMKVGFIGRMLHHPRALSTSLRSYHDKRSDALFTTLKTVAITLIVLLFFSAILSAADPVFNDLVKEVRNQAFGRTVLSGILITVLLLTLTVRIPATWQEREPKFRWLGFTEMFVPSLALVLLFGLFLAIQAQYLFGSHASFQHLDITYSDYVRQGFIELLIAMLFASIISYALILKQHALENLVQVRRLQWVNGVLLLELLLLLASAAKRDWMYVEIYGLTRVRLIGGLFLLWLLGIIVLIAILNFRKTATERLFLRGAGILSALVVVLLNAINIDQTIASATPPRGEQKDIVYISMLSPDAARGWIDAALEAENRYEAVREKRTFTQQEKEALASAKIAAALLEGKFGMLDVFRPWQEFNSSEEYAYRLVTTHPADFRNRVRCVSRGIQSLQFMANLDLYPEEEKRVFGYEYPFVFTSGNYYPQSLEHMIRPPSEPDGLQSCRDNPWQVQSSALGNASSPWYRERMRGTFIVLDGPDGAGTTTQAALLAGHLGKAGHDVLITHEPTEGPIGKWIRKQLKGEAPITPLSLQLLFCADRAWHVDTVIEPALRKGQVVVCDRYWHSTIVYAESQGIDTNPLYVLNNNFSQPDCTILTLPPLEVSLGRIQGREEKELFEKRELQEKIYNGYKRMAEVNPLIKVVDTSKDKAASAAEILELAQKAIAAKQ